tara:strand:+ start:571 stop:906 length:336 start_codon:yes stop_codon:yes gene_type:complete
VREILLRLEALGQQYGVLVYRLGKTADTLGSAATELIELWDLRNGKIADTESAKTEAGSGSGTSTGSVAEEETGSGASDNAQPEEGQRSGRTSGRSSVQEAEKATEDKKAA